MLRSVVLNSAGTSTLDQWSEQQGDRVVSAEQCGAMVSVDWTSTLGPKMYVCLQLYFLPELGSCILFKVLLLFNVLLL